MDRLTKRAKHSEAAYLEVYQNLYEAPDPSGCLAAGMKSASRISDLEVHIRKQAQELAEYMVEAKDIKNQDLTIRKLEEKVRFNLINIMMKNEVLALRHKLNRLLRNHPMKAIDQGALHKHLNHMPSALQDFPGNLDSSANSAENMDSSRPSSVVARTGLAILH